MTLDEQNEPTATDTSPARLSPVVLAATAGYFAASVAMTGIALAFAPLGLLLLLPAAAALAGSVVLGRLAAGLSRMEEDDS